MNYFAYPEMASWLAVPLALLILGLLAQRARRQSLERLGQWAIVSRLLPERLPARRRWILVLQVAGCFLFAAALMGPLLGAKLAEFKQRGLDVFIAVDCSLSMQAEDFKPNRMAHAKLVLSELIDRLAGSRIGVIAFAGQAYVQCPMTIDGGAAKDTLEAIDVGSVPLPGTVIGEAIRTAIKGLKAGESANRVLVLLTDGEDHKSDPEGAAKEAARFGLKIFTVGIGTTQGEPIPVLDEQGRRTGYKQDKRGQVVLSRMDPAALQKIAQATSGAYFAASQTGDEVDQLMHVLESLQQGDQKTRLFNRYENRYQWPLAAGLLLLLISLVVAERGWKRS